MPALLELQHAWRERLLAGDAVPGGWVLPLASATQRFAIYRETCLSTLVRALRLAFPAIERLVGAEFFEAAAREFITSHAPRSASLDDYGEELPAFLRRFAPAAGIAYLGDVAQLEWAVNRALRAPDVAPLDLARLAALDATLRAHVCLVPHPALTLLQLQFPADAIWRAVLAQDDAAMAAIDLAGGPASLLIERDAGGVQVRRLGSPPWHFAAQLCAGRPLYQAIEPDAGSAQQRWLAEHLSSGRFVDFHLLPAAEPEGAH